MSIAVRGNAMKITRVMLACALLGVCFQVAGVSAAEDLPQISKEGMVLTVADGGLAVYRQPDTTLYDFSKIVLLDAYVGFRKNWVRDFNRNTLRGGRIHDSDLERIRGRLSEDFRAVFSEILTEEGGYELIAAVEESTLILRPALVDVSIASPDVSADTVVRNFDFGSGTDMTLLMEFYDGSSSQILARVYNKATTFAGQDFTVESTGSNRNIELRVYRDWAAQVLEMLRDGSTAPIPDAEQPGA